MLRTVRRWVTARATDAAVVGAPWLPISAVEGIETLLARCGSYSPVIARNVANNMRALGVYSAEAHRGYFAQLGTHFAGALCALRYGGRADGDRLSPELARIAAERVELDQSLAQLQTAAVRSRGAIIMGPHITNYLLSLARLNQEVPLTVYLRYSKDTRRREAKQRWYRASGVGWISEPDDASGPLGRFGPLAAALSAGRVLFITPDLPQKRADGTGVRFFNRQIYLPAGAALLALRSGAPLFVLLARGAGRRQRLVLRGPFDAERPERGRDQRRSAIQQRLQWFAACFEQFLTEQTALWYLWGDKRWTRLLRGDRRYVGHLGTPRPSDAGDVPTGTPGAS